MHRNGFKPLQSIVLQYFEMVPGGLTHFSDPFLRSMVFFDQNRWKSPVPPPLLSILTPRGVGLELQTDLDTPNLIHPQTSLLYPTLHILSIKSNSGGFPKGGHRFPLCFHKGIGTAK